MRLARISAAAGVLLVSALAAVGCGFGAGEASEGTATLTITLDHGAEQLREATTEDPAESDSVIRFLDREAEITTRFGGNFVQSIDGLAGRLEGNARFDWFFYVNGYWSPIGAGEARVHPGDRIWWDYREWSAAYTVPAVVGSFPEPFLHGYDGERLSVQLDCRIEPADACDRVERALAERGVDVEPEPLDGRAGEALRILVGPYDALAGDPAADLLSKGPGSSGVFATIAGVGRGSFTIKPIDASGTVHAGSSDGAGLIAATRRGNDQATWFVTGTDPQGVEAAASHFNVENLRNRFALWIIDGQPVPLPLQGTDG